MQAGDGLLLAVAVLAVTFFAAPSNLSGGGFVNHRLVLFPFLTVMLWFGTFEHSARRRLAVQAAAAAIALAFLGLFAWEYASIDRHLLRSWTSATTSRRTTPSSSSPTPTRGEDAERRRAAFRTWPFVHAGGYVGGAQAAGRPLALRGQRGLLPPLLTGPR